MCGGTSLEEGAPKLGPIALSLPSRRALPVARCSGCAHAFVLPHRLAASFATDLYHGEYAGFRADPVFAEFVRGFVHRELSPRIAPDAHILDVGCGNGEFLRAAIEAGFGAEGYDISEAAVAHCRGLGLKARHGDFLTLDFERRFDLITLWDVLEHLTDPRATLARCRALLAPGGILFLKTPGTGALSVNLARIIPRLAGALLSTPAHIQFFQPAAVKQLLERAGFSGVTFVPPAPTRAPTTGGPLRRRIARRAVSTIHTLSEDRGIFAFAQAEA